MGFKVDSDQELTMYTISRFHASLVTYQVTEGAYSIRYCFSTDICPVNLELERSYKTLKRVGFICITS